MCDTDGSINTIICSSYCLFHNKNLIGMKYTDFLTEFSKEPDSEDNIYVLVSGKRNAQHVYDFEKDGLQVWVWRNRIGQFSFTMRIYSLLIIARYPYKGNGQIPYKGVHHYPYMGIKAVSNKQEEQRYISGNINN